MGALNPKGVRVDLLGGEAVRVLFDMDSLITIEDDFGSLADFELALVTKPFRTVRTALFLAGKWVGDPALAPTTVEAFGALMDPTKVREYLGKITEALYEALGVSQEEADAAVAADPTLAAALASLSPNSSPPPAKPGSPLASVKPSA